MNKRILRIGGLGLGWVVVAALGALILSPLEVSKFWRIDANSRVAVGVVVDKDCQNHGQISYAFDVNGQKYTGARGGDCAFAVKGQPINVYYNALNPAENTIHSPQSELNGEIQSVVLGGVILASFIIWRISNSWSFGKS
jgi:hypothetical protein